ncbi:hypothetical protein D3C81_1382220 [compost metagenome]
MIVILLPRIEDYLIAPGSPFPSKTNIAIKRQVNHVQPPNMISSKSSASCRHERMKNLKLPCPTFSGSLDPLLSLYRKYGPQQRGGNNHPIRYGQFLAGHIHPPFCLFSWSVAW